MQAVFFDGGIYFPAVFVIGGKHAGYVFHIGIGKLDITEKLAIVFRSGADIVGPFKQKTKGHFSGFYS